MVDTTYRVVRHTGRGGAGFYVEVTKHGEPLRRTDNFLTMAAAYSWIDQAKEQEQVPVEPARPWWRVLYRRRRSA
jgi:hypothetical protein